jgi:hypothetical protein
MIDAMSKLIAVPLRVLNVVQQITVPTLSCPCSAYGAGTNRNLKMDVQSKVRNIAFLHHP